MKIKITFILLFISFCGFSQTYKILNDRAIVGQHERMVYQKWGDWYPKPKYRNFLGIVVQTNFPAHAVWGYDLWGVPNFITPRRNKEYKRGSDIRPLKLTGLQNQRLVEKQMQKMQTEKIEETSDNLLKKSVRDFIHWSQIAALEDPLWFLYYKRMLKPLRNMDANPNSYSDWGLPNQLIYHKLNTTGAIEHLKELLDLMKHNYEVARGVNMPRGKRILLYHKTLMDWRKFEKYRMRYVNEVKHFYDINAKMETGVPEQQTMELEYSTTDKETVKKIIERWEDLKR